MRLTLFTEALQDQPWVPRTLEQLDRSGDLTAAFLDAAFSREGALTEPPLRSAARSVLKSLLPEPGLDFGGGARSQSELFQAAGAATSPVAFEPLLGILADRLHLITGVDPATAATPRVSPTSEEPYYRLTSDLLVEPLRAWLFRDEEPRRPSPFRCLNINTVSEADLGTLPGVGPAIARRIIQGRPHRHVDDLFQLPGIRPKRLERIKEFLAVQ